MPAAYLIGTISQPEVALTFDFSDRHATTGQPLQAWVKGLPGRRWDRSAGRWTVQCFGAMPTAALREAGFMCDPEAQHPERHESLDGVFDLDELVPPLVLAHETRPIAVVRMRFSGWDRTKRFLPLGATWDKATQRFEVRLVDLVTFSPQGERVIWPNLQYMGNTVERAFAQSLVDAPTDSAIATVAATAAMSTGLDLTKQAEEAVASLVAEVGDIPDDFTMALYPYQRLGALAAAAGRGLLADSPGLGKTRQALAAASLRRSHRTVIVVPPVVVTNWVKETEESSLAKNCHGEIVMFRAGRKERPFPDRGVVVIPDSLMVSRPHLVQQAIDWAPEVFVYDEAHRARNWESKRSEVMRAFSEQLPADCLRIAISGTPLFSQPHELASILAITGHLDPVFGGYSNFLTEYSKQNHFKAWVAQKKKLPQLRQRLSEHVWVRRLKADVLKDLPPKSRVGVFVDVDLKDYRKAHDEVIDKITDWLVSFWDEKAEEAAKIIADPKVSPEVEAKAGPRWPNGEEKDSWARQQIGLMSPLRKAAGVAKVPVALDTINDWVASNRLDNPAPDGSLYDRPLLVWAHHQEVIAALQDGIAAANKEVQVAVEIIDGATPAATRGAIVDRFQAGKIGVLIASNTAAGVGITLTRGSDMIFVETDWTPAIVSQCEDRQCRIGQTQPVICKTLIAPETLDQRIQKVLLTKAEVLNEVLGGTEADVAVASTDDDLVAPAEIILALIEVAEPKAVKALKERAKLAA
ncbi:DEAD/DEAH box helicase [Aeromicrobium sp. 179-A 4D2 NHS]|uniref:DEAD/DEAH box helicase n=1 Tax=Aeromicrobium sp. 179-A 4D2 NHS TaxID=3142375 RepID=UPI0039A35D23